MLLAYLDEVGEPGAYISKSHARFNTSPGFGYAGFVISDANAREFGAIFTREKRALFVSKHESASTPGVWEIKGASMFRSKTPGYAPQNIRVFKNLCRQLNRLGGRLFYYVDEKPTGTPKQVSLDMDLSERRAMEEVLNRVCRAANDRNENIMFMIDAISEDQRSKRLPNMYAHILGRAIDKPEMRRAVEPPMHIDSELSASIQLADWTAAIIGRAVEYQLLASGSGEIDGAHPVSIPVSNASHCIQVYRSTSMSQLKAADLQKKGQQACDSISKSISERFRNLSMLNWGEFCVTGPGTSPTTTSRTERTRLFAIPRTKRSAPGALPNSAFTKAT